MKSVLLCISVSLLIANVVNGVPVDYNALSERERKVQEKRHIKPWEYAPISYELVQMGGGNVSLQLGLKAKLNILKRSNIIPTILSTLLLILMGTGLSTSSSNIGREARGWG